MCKEAYNYLRKNYDDNFAPVRKLPQLEHGAENSAGPPPKKKVKKTALATFLDDSDDEAVDIDVPLAELSSPDVVTEVDTYLAMPQVSRVTTDGDDILAWWKKHSGMFPNLSKMARQFLALPASSAGVERLFSAAGRMHDSFRKSTKEVTLQAQLCVYQNS